MGVLCYPSHGTEAMTITATTIEALESIQVQMARFILQLPSSASGVEGFVDAGLKPIGERVKECLEEHPRSGG